MVRKFQKTHLDKVMSIWLDSNINVHSFISKSYWEFAFNFVRSAIPLTETYVYEEDGEVLGFIGVQDTYIAGMFVDASARSRGVGKKLLDYAKTVKTELNLKVYLKNERAISFYKREDFVIESETTDVNTNEAELVMNWQRKEL